MAKKPPPADPAPALQSFGALLRERGVAVGEVPAPAAAPADAPMVADPLDLSDAGALVVRRERKRHGGKTVTVVDGLTLPPARLDALARAMRRALGCGSWTDAGRVALQGDRADQAAAWLHRHGARRVTRGN
jgi:translation initiation factor 1